MEVTATTKIITKNIRSSDPVPKIRQAVPHRDRDVNHLVLNILKTEPTIIYTASDDGSIRNQRNATVIFLFRIPITGTEHRTGHTQSMAATLCKEPSTLPWS
jgi:hypothetical protein